MHTLATEPSRRTAVVLLACLVVLGMALRAPGLMRPFGTEISGWTGAHYSQIADNTLALGRPVLHANPFPSADEGVPYATHPPGTPWLAAISRGLFGRTAFASRLPFFLLSGMAILLAYRLARFCRGESAGLLAAAALATCPVAALFGHQVEVVGALVLVGILGVTRAYCEDRRAPSGGAFARLVLWSLVLVLSDWPGVLFLMLLAGHATLFGGGRRRRDLLWCAIWGAALVAVVGYLVAQLPGGLDYLGMKVRQRSVNLRTDTGQEFSLEAAAIRWADTQVLAFGQVLLAAMAAFVLRLLWRPRKAALAPLLLLVYCVIFYGVAVQAHFQHDFWSHPVAGAYAVVAGCVFAELLLQPRWRLLAGLVVVAVGLVATPRYRTYSTRNHSAPAAVRDHSQLAGWLAAQVPEEDLVAVFDDTHWPTLYHYAGRRLVTVADEVQLADLFKRPVMNITDWIQVEAATPPTWVLARHGSRAFDGPTVRHGAWELGRLERR